MNTTINFLLVFIGGGFGSMARYSIGLLTQSWQARFPWATLVANGIACLVIGMLVGLTMQEQLPEQRRLLLATGFCGGLSTFSTFTAETWHLFQAGQVVYAVGNMFLSLALCFGCLLLGMKISA